MEKIISTRSWIKSFDGIKLYYAADIPKNCKSIIIFLHGFSEHLGVYEYLKDKLNSYDYGLYRFDLRGHGRSEGKRGYINDFRYFLEDTDVIVNLAKKECANLPIFMFGYSLGGFIATSYGIKYKNKINGQILSGAATMPPLIVQGLIGTLFRVISIFHPNMKINNKIFRFFIKSDNPKNNHERDHLILDEATLKLHVEFLVKGIKWLNKNISHYNMPCLILHGGNDKVIIKEASEKLYRKISSLDKEIRIYEDLCHELVNEQNKDIILDDIRNWIEKRIDDNNEVYV